MISDKIINVLLLALTATVTAIPVDFFCCPPELGEFQYIDPSSSNCWQENTNQEHPLPLTSQRFNVFLEEEFNFTITDSNKVYIVEQNTSIPKELKHGEACFANITDPESGEITRVIVICEVEQEDESVLGYCMLVSAIFLLLTTVVYSALPEVRDVQGKSIINFSLSMGIGLALLSNFQLRTISDMTACTIQAFLMYFFLVTCFFWTTAISVQILLNLRGLVVNNCGWKEFCWYALFAWGCPAVLTVCLAILNFHPGDHMKPGIGANNCWFSDTTLQWYYMYSVITILIFGNICIFIYTSVHLWGSSFSSDSMKALRYKFYMSLRLFIITGISWIFEMISSFTKKSTVWYIFDMYNALQGPLIFLLLVVFRKRVVKALLKRGYLCCAAIPIQRYLSTREDDEEGVMQHENMSTWVFNGDLVE